MSKRRNAYQARQGAGMIVKVNLKAQYFYNFLARVVFQHLDFHFSMLIPIPTLEKRTFSKEN